MLQELHTNSSLLILVILQPPKYQVFVLNSSILLDCSALFSELCSTVNKHWVSVKEGLVSHYTGTAAKQAAEHSFKRSCVLVFEALTMFCLCTHAQNNSAIERNEWLLQWTYTLMVFICSLEREAVLSETST